MATAEHPSEGSEPRQLHPAVREQVGEAVVPAAAGGPPAGPSDAGRIVDALKASSDQEFQIAERLASKARQAYALAAGVFVVSQTVAFSTFEADNLSGADKQRIVGLALLAVVFLALATWKVFVADDVLPSGDLPLADLEDDLNAAYDGDPDVVGRLGGYYLGIVKSRRNANKIRREAYKTARGLVALALAATVAEVIVSLVARIG